MDVPGVGQHYPDTVRSELLAPTSEALIGHSQLGAAMVDAVASRAPDLSGIESTQSVTCPEGSKVRADILSIDLENTISSWQEVLFYAGQRGYARIGKRDEPMKDVDQCLSAQVIRGASWRYGAQPH